MGTDFRRANAGNAATAARRRAVAKSRQITPDFPTKRKRLICWPFPAWQISAPFPASCPQGPYDFRARLRTSARRAPGCDPVSPFQPEDRLHVVVDAETLQILRLLAETHEV